MELSKKYTPTAIEDKWYEQWIAHDLFKSVPDDRPPYTIVIPPPNVTGVLHMGHMLNNTLQDVLIRRKRMQGFNACWVPGTDHASIATEAKVVKMLADQGIQKRDLSREDFLKHAFEWKEKYGGIILQQLKKLGASCDWSRTRFTMDENYYKEVIRVFCDLHDKGHIYRGIRMVNWDPSAQTAVSDEEVIFKDIQGKLHFVRYAIEGESDQYITIATTRPETILGDTAIAVHPDDERYKHLHGKKALVPLLGRAIPIIQDDYLDMEFGTGCLKVTPAHDINDYEIGLRHNLETIDVLNPDGTMSEAAGLYIGEDRFKARKLIMRDLEEQGHIVKLEDYNHSVGHSERTNAVIEPRLSLQWFLKMEDLSKPALEAVLSEEVKLIPPKFVNTYRHWMENVRDWCLSRQLWWGHQIPAYYIKGGNDYVVAESAEAALERAKAKTADDSLTMADLRQDEDVLDTWASSWLWPISVFDGIMEPDNKDIQYYYPTNDLVTAPEILFFWVARMIIAGFEYKDGRPFNNVYLTGIVRDKKRRKMSKSLGNSPDPLDLIEQYGADGVRVGMLFSSPAGNDLLFDEGLVEQGRNFANKIWNAFRLVKGWEVVEGDMSDLDQIAQAWMEARISTVSQEIEDHFEKFRISDALMSMYKLIWDDFCSWYLELVKPPYGQPIASETLKGVMECFNTLMKMLHPFMPFLTEEIWQSMEERKDGEFICITSMPAPTGQDGPILQEMELINEVVSAVRKFRMDKQMSPKETIELFIKTGNTSLFDRYRDLLTKFLNTSSIEFVADQVDGTASIRVQAHEFYIPQGAIDVEAEREKIEKEIEYTEGFLVKVEKKLANERFVNNAPEQVVAKERKKKADAEATLVVLRESLAQLG